MSNLELFRIEVEYTFCICYCLSEQDDRKEKGVSNLSRYFYEYQTLNSDDIFQRTEPFAIFL